ncbi:MAG: hypothetical protein IGQ45_15790 [Cyanobacterium sp. T60_A2020_053]|nr:hypothetical protein [Cyanobacterium sp. T60_A2020_053]
MNIEQAIIEQIRQLPTEQQQQVLLFSQLLKQNILPTPNPNLTPKERSEQWQKWLQNNNSNDHPPLPEESLHRDTMYD